MSALKRRPLMYSSRLKAPQLLFITFGVIVGFLFHSSFLLAPRQAEQSVTVLTVEEIQKQFRSEPLRQQQETPPQPQPPKKAQAPATKPSVPAPPQPKPAAVEPPAKADKGTKLSAAPTNTGVRYKVRTPVDAVHTVGVPTHTSILPGHSSNVNLRLLFAMHVEWSEAVCIRCWAKGL
jgi:hypothetical protein